MQIENNSDGRRNFLKTSVFSSIAGAFIAVNPIKLCGLKANNQNNGMKKVIVHPQAVKRNKNNL